jgi:hypothetical protein
MTRYFGVLAGNHALRSRVVPDTHVHDDEPKQPRVFRIDVSVSVAVTARCATSEP